MSLFGASAKKKPRPAQTAAAESTKPGPNAAKSPVDQKRDRESARSRLKSASSREIGPLPGVTDPARRDECEFDLERFCLVYFPAAFNLPFSDDHKKVIAKLQRAVLKGGLFAIAMPRGSGKTTICLAAAIWALLYGHRRFVVLIGATAKKSTALLATIKTQLRTNEVLLADFPEACHPIKCLEDDGRRANGQILSGVKTLITWGKNELVFPTVAGSKSSGAIVTVCGLTGAIRGQNYNAESGEVLRPELAIVDDAQTRASAWSASQCETRLSLLMGDVLGLAGPGKKIAVAFPCTVIRKGDLADQVLTRKLFPDFQGERCKMVYSFPTNEKLWEEYNRLRSESLERDGDGSEATEFYLAHRDEMDKGATVAWPARFNADEISAVQHAMNLRLRDNEAFCAESQNEPHVEKSGAIDLTPELIVTKLNGVPRGIVPGLAEKLTAFIDVHGELLYWLIVAWQANSFEGWVIDYGTFPEQPRRYFSLRQANPTLSSVFPGRTEDAAIYAGLKAVVDKLTTNLTRDDGAIATVDKILIDSGYKPSVVHSFIRASGKAALLMPSRGVGIGAANKPMAEYQRKPGELLAKHWMIPKPAPGEVRGVRHDANHWKSFVLERVSLPAGTQGALTLPGKAGHEHKLLSDHWCAEFGTPTEGQGRRLVEYRPKPGHPDNHWFDCVVGNAVAGSLLGCGKSALGNAPIKSRRKSYRKPVYLT